MAVNTDMYSQSFESRRALFPQNCVESGEESDLGCISIISNSSSDTEDELSDKNTSNIDDYDIIGIVRKDEDVTPEATPNVKYLSPIIEESPLGTPVSQPSTSRGALFLTSPTYNLKTPHDTLTMNSKIPKLTHKSVADTCSSAPIKRKLSPYNSPELLNNSLKCDIKNSKVRTTLFPESDLYLPPKRFYSRSESVMDQLKENKSETAESYLEKLRGFKKSPIPAMPVNSRKKKSKRKTPGKINAGVTHKIRKPKQKKITPLPLVKSTMSEAQSKALKYYLDNLKELQFSKDQSKLLENKENTSPEISALINSCAEFPTIQVNGNLLANNQLFHTAVPNINVQETSVNLPQYISTNAVQNSTSTTISSLPSSNLFCDNQFITNETQFAINSSYDHHNINNHLQQFTTIQNSIDLNEKSTNQFVSSQDFPNEYPTNTFLSNQSVVSSEDLSRKRPLSPMAEDPEDTCQRKKFFKFSRGHKGIVTMNPSMKLIVDHGKMSLVGGSTPSKTVQQKPQNFEPEPFEVEEPIMSQVVMDNILSALESDPVSDVNNTQSQQLTVFPPTTKLSFSPIMPPLAPGSIVASTTNPANLILSPISQMCDVTSGLALSSPKKVKNLSSLIENVSRSPKKGFLLPPRDSVGKKKPFTLAERKLKKLHKDQMLLDAGQKKFGVTQCPECNFVYHMGDPIDEASHKSYHDGIPVLKFGGWKNERLAADLQQKGRIIHIKPGDPKLWWKRVSDLMEIVNREMGCYSMEFNLEDSQVFLYVKSKIIVGCLVAVQVQEGYRMLTTKSHETDLCSERSFPVKCGVARIWVSPNSRKQGIGAALMNALKRNFFFGSVLNNSDIAFSSPTELGKTFAKKYFNTPNYMIYFS